MGCLGPGLARDVGRPVLPLPIDQVLGRCLGHAFPPDIALVRERHVREDHVAPQGLHAVEVGVLVGARRHAEIAGFGVDGIQAPVRMRLDPGDVVADRRDRPTFHRIGRDQHGEVGLAAGARERRGNVELAAGRCRDTHHQHVLGQPALFAAHVGGDAQREALLAEQRVAAIAGAVAPDFFRLGVMHDVLRGVARPSAVGRAGPQRSTHAVHARHKMTVRAQHLEHRLAHARHDLHVDHDIRAVGQLDADVRNRRAQRPHRERHDVHRPALHCPFKQRRLTGLQDRPHLVGRHPVVGRACVLLTLRADVGTVFDPRDIAGVAARQIAVRASRRIELQERARGHQPGAQLVVFGAAAVAPVHRARLGQRGHLRHPVHQPAVVQARRHVPLQAFHDGTIHDGS